MSSSLPSTPPPRPTSPPSALASATDVFLQGVTVIGEEQKDGMEDRRLPPPRSIHQRLMDMQAASGRLAEELALLELEKVTRLVQQQQAALIIARREDLVVPVVNVAVPTILSTPLRVPLLPRRLPMTAASRRGLSSASLAHQATIDELPDAATTTPGLVTVVVPAGSSPSTQSSVERLNIKLISPLKFTGSDEKQNAEVESWLEELGLYFLMSRIPPEEHLQYALTFMRGPALTWFGQKRLEVEQNGKTLTWPWLQAQLIKDYGRANGAIAMRAEWEALRMGTHGDKPTRTVASYTSLFTKLMMALTSHTHLTHDLLVIERYTRGIRDGYPALYETMLGRDKFLNYATLAEAVEGAQLAETELAIGKTTRSTSSSSSSFRFPRQSGSPAVGVNNLQGESQTGEHDGTSGEGETHPSANTITTRPNDGRHHLTPVERQMLYDGKRCYRCYAVHPFGGSHPRCNKPVQKIAPLKS